MTVRAYLCSNFTPTVSHPHQSYLLLTNQARISLSHVGGIYFTEVDPMAPIHHELRKLITHFTYRAEHLCGTETSKRLVPGHYVHGKFRAEVKHEFRHGHSVFVITASAPTRSLLTRWIRALENGGDLPNTATTSKRREKAAIQVVDANPRSN